MDLENIFRTGTALVVAAHSDDEVIGLGAQLPLLGPRVIILHTTNGSPRNLADARRAGFSTQKHYEGARRVEFLHAMGMVGVTPAQCYEMGLVDQESLFEMERITRMIRTIIIKTKPDAIFTHPYEGGHPDHDTAAFGVQMGVTMVKAEGLPAPIVYEFTSYFAGRAGMVTGQFLPRDGIEIKTFPLSVPQQALKRRMFDCFVTQQPMLAAFRVDAERFRLAPRYDFTKPPHNGRLLYETFDWGLNGIRWRHSAADATQALPIKRSAANNP